MFDKLSNLRSAFEQAVDTVLENGIPQEIDLRRSELMKLVVKEANRRKSVGPYSRDATADPITGRKRYEKY
ncbi:MULTISPECIES: hypothetical protein [Clostridia]|uniref:hypothetical protein n=1 Tax=Clostridia TaxID=186801 RepID=UPI000EA35C6D|nr:MULTISPECIES: hypothetical protein [Clostridia]NBJ71016.1 hypothetical protein [Roseburia sp. 1XD42-34]RKI75451.1 hypothetical protein D7V87_16370 [Clostridium sp. 1xD42-85]